MIELRWATPEHTTTKPPTLQYCISVAVDASGALCPGATGEWKDVPLVAVPGTTTGEWRSIETAPKDELILVCTTKRMIGPAVAMNHSRDGWVIETPSDWASIYPPKHWMPLPEPPNTN
jgi:hypothetical protein